MSKPAAIAAFLICSLGAGCAKSSTSEPSRATDSAWARPFLADVALSAELDWDGVASACSRESARKSLDEAIAPDVESAPALWASCQKLFACSPTTQAQLQKWFVASEKFRIGFADLHGIGGAGESTETEGAYMPGTTTVYLDKSLKFPREICHALLHELVHRFDPAARGGEISLRVEYRAFWHQNAFLDELYLSRVTAIPAQLAGYPYVTRQALLADVTDLYRFPPDERLVESYPKLPLEAALERDGRP